MSSKIGTILSLIFVSMFFLLGVDLMCLQLTLSNLDAKSVVANAALVLLKCVVC